MIFDEFSKLAIIIKPYYGELKKRLLIISSVFFLVSVISLNYHPFIWDCFFSTLKLSSRNFAVVIRGIGSGFILTIKLSLILSLLITLPIMLWQILAFIEPACYASEKKYIRLRLILYSIYFYGTQILNFIFITPYLLNLLIDFNTHVALPMPDVDDIVSFALTMQFTALFGAFAPILLAMAIDFNWVSVDQLRKIRPYAYVFIFILAMLLTPPDVIAQCILAVPLVVLYELILIIKK